MPSPEFGLNCAKRANAMKMKIKRIILGGRFCSFLSYFRELSLKTMDVDEPHETLLFNHFGLITLAISYISP